MLDINPVYNCSFEDLVSNIDNYVDLFLDNGLVCFKKIHLNTDQQNIIISLFGKKLNWKYISSSHIEDHSYSISMNEKVIGKDEIMIQWHIEHLQRVYTQVAACWNMVKFTCPKGHGNTGFIDSSYLYKLMPSNWQEFLKCAIVTHDTMSFPHRKCLIPHRNSGKKILRLSPHFHEDVLISVNGKNPSSQDISFFDKIKEWYCDQIQENELVKMWWEWDEGDLIIVDLLYMIHSVKGGFTSDDRQFTRNWAYARKSDFSRYAKPEFNKKGL